MTNAQLYRKLGASALRANRQIPNSGATGMQIQYLMNLIGASDVDLPDVLTKAVASSMIDGMKASKTTTRFGRDTDGLTNSEAYGDSRNW